MRIILSFLLFSFSMQLFAQVQPTAVFGYNACDLSEESGAMFLDGVEQGGIACECGVLLESMELDGNDDCATLDSSLIDILEDNFTFSFYFFPDVHTSPSALFAIKDTCLNRDSSMLIKYFPQENEIEIGFSLNIADRITFKKELDPNQCWHHVVLTKNGNDYAFYLNGDFVESDNVNIAFPFGENYSFEVGNSSCVGLTDQKFHGKLDEISFYNESLSAEEISSLYLAPDQILSNDTTIFLGNSVMINFDGSCGNVSWFPTTGLDNPGINPLATPEESTLYELTIAQGNCVIKDSININVVTDEDISCGDLLLPNAFTPNGDGLNDDFGVSNEFIVDALDEFIIYDRWGAEIFYSNIKGERWNGFLNGNALNPGMFAYKVRYQCKNMEYEKIGAVSILR